MLKNASSVGGCVPSTEKASERLLVCGEVVAKEVMPDLLFADRDDLLATLLSHLLAGGRRESCASPVVGSVVCAQGRRLWLTPQLDHEGRTSGSR